MKRYYAIVGSVHDGEIPNSMPVYLAADMEALKAGARERVLALLDGEITESDREHARQMVAAVFEEGT